MPPARLYVSRHRSYPSRTSPPSLAVLPVSEMGAPNTSVPSKGPLNVAPTVVGFAAAGGGLVAGGGAVVGEGAPVGAVHAATARAAQAPDSQRTVRAAVNMLTSWHT